MALTKIGKEGITGISNASDATFLTATSGEGVTLAGTLAVTGVHTVGNNAIHTSDGGAVTQNLVQGLSKLFVKFQGNDASVNDSFNVSSVDDDAAGYNGVNFTNSMATIHYATHSTTAHNYGISNDGWFSGVASSDGESGMTTSSVQLSHGQAGGSNADPTAAHVTIDGDLA
jgi:hypothetical protein